MSPKLLKLPKLWPVHLSGAAMDFSLYLFHGVLFFFVILLGGESKDLGNVAGAGAISYVAAAVLGGRISDRLPRLRLARLGCVSFVGGVLAMIFCQKVWQVTLLCVPLGASMGFFWPPLQAHLADLAGPGRLAAATGRFNVAWATGKGLGFFTAASLVTAFESLGERGAIIGIFAIAAGVATIPLLLLGVARKPAREPATAAEPAPAGARGVPYRTLAWIANFAYFGAGATLVAHHPKWIKGIGLGEAESNLFLGTIFLFQMASFLIWSGYGRWRYRLREVWAMQVVFLLALAALPFSGGFGPTLAIAPLIGLGLGLGYQASLYYSLDVKSLRGKSSGLHEGVLGSGNFVLPLAAGWVAQSTGGWTAAPYLLAAGAVLIGLLLQVLLARKAIHRT